MTYFFHRKFNLPEGELGTIFFFTSSIAAASMLVATSIARRIGNLKVCLVSARESVPANHSRPWSSPTCHQLSVLP